ncbi:transcriptional regulator, TetR family [Desulfatibacillum aliphaticivorans]|uniref:Transcriptional regulator, TetR family n=1 Tax=Desulfatibacillum aliphaticivorans TaxID=218208 RepID=B8FKN0_DESAL|nr:TetR/AcrR family transcriptional regulator [Desulfatibacillum aliphaticivorans]ACL04402.1 transcriptional regulator, TetR family [Desulfatibacillum aliphaticivorans]
MKLTEKKRADILEAAVEEFKAGGFQGTSMDRIASTAKVSKRTVYNHFASKKELFRAILVELVKRGAQAPDQAYDPERPLDEQLFEIANQELALFSSQDFLDLARVTLAEYILTPELARRAFDEMNDKELGVHTWIRQAAEDGRLRVADHEMAAHQFLGLIKSFTVWPQLVGGQPLLSSQEAEQVIRSAVAMFLDHYGVE